MYSLYFTATGHAGGLVFDFEQPEVRDFLIQNAKFFLNEYRVDGFRYDQVSVIDHDGAPGGRRKLAASEESTANEQLQGSNQTPQLTGARYAGRAPSGG
ncbi:alpha-amylase family glycosyl hydrolase [Paraburkholderia hospita]|uniref:alpha-amylase family glycosyl hydrolase n=1 Tax=Paraburkholderia hospita TaxID=169430 RepID=UPI000B348F76|nr:hypothetical protein [Paraburkholderia hospita]OUL71008.1 hypothetical protein CA601_46660 [Paraburkholderia hospita]